MADFDSYLELESFEDQKKEETIEARQKNNSSEVNNSST